MFGTTIYIYFFKIPIQQSCLGEQGIFFVDLQLTNMRQLCDVFMKICDKFSDNSVCLEDLS